MGAVLFIHFISNHDTWWLSGLTRLAIDSLEECLDIGPVEASLGSAVFKLLPALFQPSKNKQVFSPILAYLGANLFKEIIERLRDDIFDN